MPKDNSVPLASFDLAVTRHAGLLSALRRCGFVDADVPVLEHVTPADLKGKHVIGVLPLHLACHAETVTEVVLDLAFDQRGKELSADETLATMRGMKTYRVVELENE